MNWAITTVSAKKNWSVWGIDDWSGFHRAGKQHRTSDFALKAAAAAGSLQEIPTSR